MKSITYRFEVTAMFPLAESDDDVDNYTEAQAVSVEHRRSLNKALFALLKRKPGIFDDAVTDCELLDFSVEEDGDAPRTSEDAREAEADRQWKESR